MLPADEERPTGNSELLHLGSVALQTMFAGFGPMADWYYLLLFCLIETPECYKILTDEIRDKFESYDDINIQSTAKLHYLTACLEESLRIISTNSAGLPRYSPGAVVDGHYIPKGVRDTLTYTILHTPKTNTTAYYLTRLPSSPASSPSAEAPATSMIRGASGQNGSCRPHIPDMTRSSPMTHARAFLRSVSGHAPA